MALSLDGTVALVTGASSGIGEATARALADAGALVAAVARRKDRLDELAGVLGASRALAIEADIGVRDQARAAVERTVERFGRLDILVNNAGLMLLGPIAGADTDEWDRMLAVNVHGLMYCTDAALPHLLRAAESEPRRVADVINVSSVAGRFARSGAGVYNATKFGVGAFSESLRQEVTRRYVRVTVIEPGAVATELASHNRPEVLQSLRAGLAIQQWLDASDVADAIKYAVTRERHVSLNEILIRPTEQER